MKLIYVLLFFIISCSNLEQPESHNSQDRDTSTENEVTEIPKSFYLTSTSMPLSFGPEVFTSANDEANTKTFSIADTSKEYFLYVEASEDMEYERARFKILLNGQKVRVKRIKKGKIKIRPVQLLEENILEVRVKSKREKSIKISIASSDSLTPVFGPVTVKKVNEDLNTKYRGNNRKTFLTQKFEFDLSDPVSEAYLVLESKSNAKAKVTLKLNGEKIIRKRKLSLNRREKIVKLVSLQELNTIEVITRGKGEFELSILRSGDTLPPDPGEEGEKTLLGIDSDNDGLRDDLQRHIYFNYADKPVLQQALTQFTKSYDNSFKNTDGDKAAAILSSKRFANSLECAVHVFDLYDSDSDQLIDMILKIENTLDRFLAARKIDSLLSGQVFELSNNPGQHCEFDTSTSLFLTESKVEGEEPGTTVMYINGVRNTFSFSYQTLFNNIKPNASKIEKLNSEFNNPKFKLLYQEAPDPEGTWGTLVELIKQVGGEAVSQKIVLYFLQKVAYGRNADNSIVPQWLIDAYVDWTRSHSFDGNSYSSTDHFKQQISAYKHALAEGRRLIVSAHSQGTLFANIGYSQLFFTSEHQLESKLQSSIGLIFAGPAANKTADGRNLYAKFEDDILSFFPNTLPPNLEHAGLGLFGSHAATSYFATKKHGETGLELPIVPHGYDKIYGHFETLANELSHPFEIKAFAKFSSIENSTIGLNRLSEQLEETETLEVEPGDRLVIAGRGMMGGEIKIDGIEAPFKPQRVLTPDFPNLTKKAYQVVMITIPDDVEDGIESIIRAEQEGTKHIFKFGSDRKITINRPITNETYTKINALWVDYSPYSFPCSSFDQCPLKNIILENSINCPAGSCDQDSKNTKYGPNFEIIEYGNSKSEASNSVPVVPGSPGFYEGTAKASSSFDNNLSLSVFINKHQMKPEYHIYSWGYSGSLAGVKDTVSVKGGIHNREDFLFKTLNLYFDVDVSLSHLASDEISDETYPFFQSSVVFESKDRSGNYLICKKWQVSSLPSHPNDKETGEMNTDKCVLTVHLDQGKEGTFDISLSAFSTGSSNIEAAMTLNKVTFADGVTTPESVGAELIFASGTKSPN